MKVTHLNHSDKKGGAARFAFRTHEAVKSVGVKSELIVSAKQGMENDTIQISNLGPTFLLNARAKLSQFLDQKIRVFERTENYHYKSPSMFGAISKKNVDNFNSDVVHLHWVNGGLISIKTIGQISKPVVWSILDMWPFLGAEHYDDYDATARWVEGFSKTNRSKKDHGLDICLHAWNNKIKYWNNLNLVAPGAWLRNRALESNLFKESKITIIPPAINTKFFTQLDKSEVRKRLGLPENTRIIGYGGAFSGRKGWEIFREILENGLPSKEKVAIVVFGTPINSLFENFRIPIYQFGLIDSDAQLRDLYSAMDLLIMPSLVEAYGLIAQEAQSCGVPVVGFSETGIADVIAENRTGLLVTSRDSESLSLAIVSILEDKKMQKEFSLNARNRAITEWDYSVVGQRYLNLYRTLVDF